MSPASRRCLWMRAPTLGWSQWTWVTWGLVLAVTAVQFGAAIVANWSVPQWEDPLFIQHVSSMGGLSDVFGRGSAWAGIYRPLSTNLVFWLGRALGHNMPVYHCLVLLVYLTNAGLFFELARRLLGAPLALLAVLLLCSRAANTETLLYATQLQTTLPCTFALMALWVALQDRSVHLGRRVISLSTLCGLALLSKEQMVVLPLAVTATTVARSSMGGDRVSWREIGITGLAMGLVGVVWYAWARRFLSVASNPWWSYDFGLVAVLRNYAFYLASFSNCLVRPVVLHEPAIFLDEFTVLVQLAPKLWPVVGVGLIAGGVGLAVDARIAGRSTTGSPIAGRSIAGRWIAMWLGLVWFGLFLAPVVVFVNRRLMYYGYASHMGVSLALAAASGMVWESARRWKPRRATANVN